MTLLVMFVLTGLDHIIPKKKMTLAHVVGWDGYNQYNLVLRVKHNKSKNKTDECYIIYTSNEMVSLL